MNASFDVIERGVLYIDKGTIHHVAPADAPAPPGFEDSPVIRTGDTIYPGLIELHNHLSYNVLPVWHVPKQFNNRGQWPQHSDYRKLISGPMGVLGRTAGYIQAVVRYVECKCLLGGVTTSQGIALFSNNLTRRYYRGIVRNVEETNEEDLPEASTRVADVEARDAAKFLKRLERSSTLLLHLSEGIDRRARDHFRALKIAGRKWAITPALAGIHCAGLKSRDFATLRVRGGSMIWSPLSNLLLYGDTARIAAAKKQGVTIALGSDWSPSGSKNLLGELKAAWLVSREAGDVFTPRDILRMATLNPAKILKWDRVIGSIEAGKRADLLVVNGRRGDAYEMLLGSRETAITLMVINGVARYGQPRLMKRLTNPTESWRVGDSKRALFLEQASADEIVGALTLTEARDRLVDGMHRLPELARALEVPDVSAPTLGAPAAGQEERWFLELNHEDSMGFAHRHQLPMEPGGDFTGLFSPAAATRPLSELLAPRELDPLTVADDPHYLHTMADQPNLPEYVKRGLPGLY
jgi:cytosine/adenosine deaminase-related metal-dependent hydrolase